MLECCGGTGSIASMASPEVQDYLGELGSILFPTTYYVNRINEVGRAKDFRI